VKALVIGGTGFIGVASCKELMRRGVETVAASRTTHPYGTFTSHVAFDRGDEAQLASVLRQVQPDVILDLAGAQASDVEMLARHFHVGRLVVAAQDDMQLPDDRDAHWTFIRPGAVFGAGDPSRRIVAYLARIEDGAALHVPLETWEQPLALTWVRDAGYALALAADPRKDAGGKAYEVGYEDVSLRRLIETFGSAMGRRPQIVPVPMAELPDHAKPYRHAPRDISAARRDLGFEPSPLPDAVAETLAWYRVARLSQSRRRPG
jgi:nucleoside-diphosphate-sugar epimerase